MKKAALRTASLQRVGWPLVFLANLPVPVRFGWGVTDWGGRIGMIAAIGVLYVLGRESMRRVPGLDAMIIWGGTLIALSQFYPVIHILAGVVGIRAAFLLRLVTTEWPGEAGMLAGCIITLLTGGILMAIAVVAGLSNVVARMLPDPHHAHGPAKSAQGLDDLA
jgi:hypothetical protein